MSKSFKTLDLFYAIKEWQPSQIMIQTHYYVQLSELPQFLQSDPKDFDCVQIVMPTGAAVPEICKSVFETKMLNMKVDHIIHMQYIFTLTNTELKALFNGYGQTEQGVISLSLSPNTLGVIVPEVTVKVSMSPRNHSFKT